MEIMKMMAFRSWPIILIILLTSLARAQWTEPVEIDGEFRLGAPRVVAVGETLHVVAVNPPWAWYLRSEDNGATWTEPIIPIDISREIERPDLKYSNGNLHLIWREFTDPLYPQLYYSRSSDGGRSWRQPLRVFANTTSRVLPFVSLATNGDTLFAVCNVYFNLYKRYLFFRSLDAGETWQDSTVIEQGPLIIIQPPRLLYAGDRLHFIHPMSVDVDSFGYEVYYRNSDDFGITWSDRIILSPAEPIPDYRHSQIPSAYADSNGRILVAWMDYRNGSMCGISGDIFYRLSLDNGDTWEPWGSITNTQSGEGSYCLILGDKFHVAWTDNWLLGCGYPKVTYSMSADTGWSWETPESISGQDVATEGAPRLAHTILGTDTVLHCFYWKHTESNGGSLFYIRNPDFVSAVDGTDMPLPKRLQLVAYPNPFNSNIMLTLIGSKGGDEIIEIFDIHGRLVKKLELSSDEGGNKNNAIWDATDNTGRRVSSGVYFARARAGGFDTAIKILYLK